MLANGRLGINTTNPRDNLEVFGGIRCSNLTVDAAATFGGTFTGARVGLIDGLAALTHGDSTKYAFGVQDSDTVAGSHADVFINSGSFCNIRFQNNYTTRMTMTSAGFLGLNTGTPSYPVDIFTTAELAINSNNPVGTYGYVPSTNTLVSTNYIAPVTGNVSLRASGALLGTAFFSTSDARVKERVAPLDENVCMQAVSGVQPVSYEYINRELLGHGAKQGFIAQEVESFLPACVSKTKGSVPEFLDDNTLKQTEVDDFRSLDTNSMLAVLWGAVRGLQKKVDALSKQHGDS
jgi:hypothetical protein